MITPKFTFNSGCLVNEFLETPFVTVNRRDAMTLKFVFTCCPMGLLK
ncbi:MAG: hypothetical protein LBP59_00715 [Planctomycetaceae bacterium]|nr:hypothetical protein [Planctomycetaceae bacterium]